MAFATGALTAEEVEGKVVVEAGSYDVNGSARPGIEALRPASYTGADQEPGPRVDLVAQVPDLPALLGAGSADVVISTEMLEHAIDWQGCVAAMIDLLAPGGVLVITTRSAGFPYHAHPTDEWRYSVEAMGQIMEGAGLEVLRLEPDGQVPGVFCKARKPVGWVWPGAPALVWAGVELTRP
jgi:SAM-dependent methyltransferase